MILTSRALDAARESGTGWVAAALVVAVATVALSLARVVRGLEGGLALGAALAALGLGWALAIRGWSGARAAVVALLVGPAGAAVWVGRLEDEIAGLMLALGRLVWESSWGPERGYGALAGLVGPAGELAAGLGVLSMRLVTWLALLVDGRPAFDPAAAALVWTLVLWGLAFWIAWALRRLDAPLPGLLPALLLLGAALRQSGDGVWPLVLALWVSVLLLPLSSFGAGFRAWQSGSSRVAEGLISHLLGVALPVTTALVAAAWLAITLSERDLLGLLRRPQEVATDAPHPLASSLGIHSAGGRSSPLERLRSPGLPNRHLIGSGPELAQTPALLVSVINLPAGSAPPAYRWRALTYDLYTGRGWRTSPTETWEYAADHPASPHRPEKHRFVRQKVRPAGEEGDGLIYAAGTLAAVDARYRVSWRAKAQDAFAATLEPSVGLQSVYEAGSWVSAADPERLRAAGESYPAWVRERYLRLPEDVPARVRALARDLTATEPTPYDRAVALESHLRSIPYTLDLPPPPANRDVVDHFLFDLRRGYCDYYASAMVVLARAGGLPARMVVGYFSGSPEVTEGTVLYRVSEADAHAWVEIYFPGVGWVEFEPTAGRPAIDRVGAPDAEAAGEPAFPGAATAAARADGRPAAPWRGVLLWGAAAGLLALLAAQQVDGWRVRRLPVPQAAEELYRRLRRRARELGMDGPPGTTPYELLQAISRGVADGPGRPLWWWIAPARLEAGQIVELYVRAVYGPAVPGREEIASRLAAWRRLHLRLMLVRLLGRRP